MSSEIVYNLMQDGITCRDKIAKKSGLEPLQIQTALSNLYKKRKIYIKEVLKVRGRDFYVYALDPKAPQRSVFAGVNSIFNVGAYER